MKIDNISVVLPIYNEESNIRDVLLSILNFLPSVTDDFEVIMVDDGSNDRTPRILEELMSIHPALKLVRHPRNIGYGAALNSGFKAADKGLIFMMDSDRQFDISEIKKFMPYISDYDLVIGFRMRRHDPFYRLILGAGFNLMTNFLFGIKTKDIDCGFKLFRKSFLKNLDLIAKGALINTEIIYFAGRHQAKMIEIGVNHYPRVYGKARGVNFKAITTAFVETISLKLHCLKNEK